VLGEEAVLDGSASLTTGGPATAGKLPAEDGEAPRIAHRRSQPLVHASPPDETSGSPLQFCFQNA